MRKSRNSVAGIAAPGYRRLRSYIAASWPALIRPSTKRSSSGFSWMTGPSPVMTIWCGRDMGFNCGIVGLPNVGKSALFTARTATQAAETTKYAFSTRDANIGRVAVPDERLDVCARLAKSAKIVPTQLAFVDIAALVRGASKGQGLGNQFLGHLREVDAIAHILRCFDDDNVVHVEGSVDPIGDAETVDTELMLADLESLERRLVAAQKRARGGEREAKTQLAVIEPILAGLQEGRPARRAALAPEQQNDLKALQLLSAKPVLYIGNVDGGAGASGN